MIKTAIRDFPSILPSITDDETHGRYSLKFWSGGFCHFDKYPTNHSHMHETYHELCFVMSGYGEYIYGQNRFALKPGTVFFSEMNIVHEITSHATRNLFLVYFPMVLEDNRLNLTRNYNDITIHRFLNGHKLHVDNCEDMIHYIHLITRHGNSSSCQVNRKNIARLFIIECLDRLAIQKSAPLQIPNNLSDDIPGKAILFIESNINKKISVKEVAQACTCSDRHLRRVFRSATGKSIIESINERKINLAAQQLLMRFTIEQVAESIGISSVSQFSRLFKKYNGMNPKDFQFTNAKRMLLPKTTFNC